MLAVNNNNNVDFQARLDVSKLRGSRQRWANIAKIFEEKTAQHGGSLNLHDGSFSSGMFFTNNGNAFDGVIYDKGSKKLKSLPDVAIAEKLKRIFLAMKKQDKMSTLANEFFSQTSHVMPRQNTTFWDSVASIIKQAKQNVVGKDRFFNENNILF